MRRRWRQGLHHLRNLILRLTITYLAFSGIRILPGIQVQDALFSTWIASGVFVLLTAFLRPILLALTLPFTITTAGLFIFVIDGILLLLTDGLTGLEIASFGWAILGSVVMSIVNIWIQSAFMRMGWMEREDEDDPQEILSPGWLLRISLIMGLLLGLVFSGLTAAQMALALSTLTGNLMLIGALAVLTLLLVSMGVAWLVAEGLEATYRARFSIVVSALATSVALIALAVILQAPVPVPEPVATTEARTWALPTGSRIAYYAYPASGEPAETPLVYLHDGPGLAVLDAERAFYRRFAEDGFDVYLYDRVGTGQSERLASIKDYGMRRNIDDLDAIRSELGVNELILIGQGGGAELAAQYLSLHPERVKQAVFLSPTPLLNDDAFFYNYARTASVTGPNPVLEPRMLMAAALAPYGPRAAEKLASQEQMRVMAEQTFNPQTWLCAQHSDRAPRVENPGFNYYVQVQVASSENALPDPRSALADNLTPSLIVAAECDYIPWSVILQYQDALLNDTVVYVEDAGHMIQATQADLLHDVIRAFLREEALPIAPYDGTANPRPPVVSP
jgi:proline iminopeptidase